EDLIESLPGATFEFNFTQYSGYLEATEGRFLHYWLTESQNDPANDPVLLWLNGGPGCSSLLGFLTELGPFYIDQDGTGELHPNPYSWNTFANVLFLESPACVGFSYDINDDCKSGDNDTSIQNYLALQDFFTKFPEYITNEFYISGESYAGIYIPTLSKRIIDGSFPINFQGFAIGNGYIDVNANDNSLVFFTYYHAVIGDDLWGNLIDSCCVGGVPSRATCEFSSTADISADCLTYVDEVIWRVQLNGLNPYNLYSNCESTSTAETSSRMSTDLRSILRLNENRPQTFATLTSDYDPACSDNSIEAAYLNDPETKAALHISDSAREWTACSNAVNLRFDRELDFTVDLIAYAAAATRGLIFNGDVDMVCNYLGNLWDVEDLGLPVVEDRRKWEDDGQVKGFVKRFENLDFLTVKGAGHMVPGYEPKAALHMIRSFIFQEDY
ncbi:UNVERIFIED_CONTAM: hypothetical protein GTU68_036394, partial [Idotea baltica]|nr:hypothetical protein [Idotea baltica]